ncbi:MBL fold metallo-hydrolase [Mangrovicella endophytica]|uniref:MBL fold metallo-hydrolase n=1 Tax=Mangrovicella endophytica TaxID=2066697 RepID=UPI000C9EBF00|nr:MBL fold metallo-hydrolase [Mangrovicella endophytica]
MADTLRLTILGCGSSPGVPRLNGDWGACDPAEPRNRRRRASALVERIAASGAKTTVVIDCGPDFREQMLSASVRHLDAVVMTHAHADHIAGFDDLRGYFLTQRALVPVHADAVTAERLMQAYDYCYAALNGSFYPPIVQDVRIRAGEAFTIDGVGGPIEFLPFQQVHGSINSLGFRIGPFAYCSDVSDFPDAAQDAVRGARHIVIDALQYRDHPSHLSLAQALRWIERFGAETATLTHMHTPLDYGRVAAELPAHIRPGYDGLRIELPA